MSGKTTHDSGKTMGDLDARLKAIEDRTKPAPPRAWYFRAGGAGAVIPGFEPVPCHECRTEVLVNSGNLAWQAANPEPGFAGVLCRDCWDHLVRQQLPSRTERAAELLDPASRGNLAFTDHSTVHG